jgi:hypothetical protein
MQSIEDGLRDQHPVKRVLDRAGQRTRPLAVPDAHRQRPKAFAGGAAGNVGRNIERTRQLAEPSSLLISYALALLT